MDQNIDKALSDEKLKWLLDKECKVPLTKGEVNFIYNVFGQLTWKLGDAKIAGKILDKLTPFAAFDTNISEKSHKEQLVLGKKTN